MDPATLDIAQLRRRYAGGAALTPEEWNCATAAVPWTTAPPPRILLDLHDLLLFITAYPHSSADHARATAGLARVAAQAAALATARPRYADALVDSAVAGPPTHALLSIDLCRWLCAVAPDTVELAGLEGEDDHVRNLLVALAHPIEREALEDARHEVLDRVAKVSGGRCLQWLVAAIDKRTDDALLRHALWESCRPNIVVNDGHPQLTRTHARGLNDPIHCFPNGTRDLGDPRQAIAQPMGPAAALNPAQRNTLLTAARGILVGHQRETDPVTHVDPRALAYHRMDHGIGVALMPLPPARRTAFDAYLGYVAFANNVPVAYGGAWLFPGKTKVGINVFPAFRGGPSSMLFAQILRCYAQRYGVGTFEAENYQLGHGNSDGIRSGAYWFYHRLGFRTQQPRLAAVAGEEAQRMRSEPGYRTPANVLRRLAAEPMLLTLHPETTAHFEPLDLSERVLEHLGRTATADRLNATDRIVQRVARRIGAGAAHRRWPAADRQGFAHLAPAVDLIPDLEEWSAAERRSLIAVMRAKGALTEDRYLHLLRRHERLLNAWSRLVATEG